jgi:PAS domain S-box-containing protein
MAKNIEDLLAEAEHLNQKILVFQQQLREANKYIDAIKKGNIDALVVAKENDLKIYIEEAADKTYRILIEKMHEGAVVLNKDETLIIYCNSYFANMVNLPLEKVTGTKLKDFIDESSKERFQFLLDQGKDNAIKGEVYLSANDGKVIPVLMSVNPLSVDDNFVLSIILTDLTIQNKNQEELKHKTIQLEQKNIELKNSEQALYKLNAELEAKVKARTDKLSETVNELKRLNSDQDTFIYTASHDLKAPLSNMEGLLYALQTELSEEAKAREEVMNLMNMMKTSIGKFRSNIADLAMTAKIDYDEKGYNEQSFKEIIEDVKFSLSDEIAKSKAIFHEELLEPKIKYSRKNIRSILYNLVSNAIKFRSPERKPEIRIRTEKIENFTLLSIADNGQGIKEEDKKNVFSMYKRLNTNVEGTGVGMAIVARIVDDNGGRIEIDSKLGKGSTFKIYLKNQETN